MSIEARRYQRRIFMALAPFLWACTAHAATTYLKARLDSGHAGVPSSNGDGAALFSYDDTSGQLTWTLTYRSLSSAPNAADIRGPAAPGATGPAVVPITLAASPMSGSASITPAQAADMLAGLWYVSLHTDNNPAGEIRGQMAVLTGNGYTALAIGLPDHAFPSNAVGAALTIDPATLQMTWNVAFSVPLGHGPVTGGFPDFNGPAVGSEFAPLPVIAEANPLSGGSMALTSAQAAEVINGFWYVAVSSSGGARAYIAPDTRLSALSTRLRTGSGDAVAIGGFVIDGAVPKWVVVRAIGPSLASPAIPNALADPVLTLVRASDNTIVATNDNWQSYNYSSDPFLVNGIRDAGLAPPDPRESAIGMSLAPGAYTAIVTGAGGTSGTALVEVFEVDTPDSPLLGISTRGQVLTSSDIVIGGFIIQGSSPQTVVVRARGPSLADAGVTGVLANPTLTLVRSSDQAVIASNDDWQSGPDAAQIQASGFAPGDPLESAIRITLPPGAYTALVSGAGGATGIGIVEIFPAP